MKILYMSLLSRKLRQEELFFFDAAWQPHLSGFACFSRLGSKVTVEYDTTRKLLGIIFSCLKIHKHSRRGKGMLLR